MNEIEEADSKLSTSLQKLELEGPKRRSLDPNANPFRRRSKSLSSITNLGPSLCDCSKVKKTTSFKRNAKKILREPILKVVKFKGNHRKVKANEALFGQASKHGEKDFKTLLNACEQLTLDSSNIDFSAENFQHVRSGPVTTNSSLKIDLGSLATCSHQARLNANPPCDVTIDELASYFETSVHIPKKMSSMAEMMYI